MNQIVSFVNRHVDPSTSQIESAMLALGYPKKSVYGGIGAARRYALIFVTATIINPVSGRVEHTFH